VFHRGQTELPAGLGNCEELFGDRSGDLEALRDRSWDAVIDIATYEPEWVTSIADLLVSNRAVHYTFISTASVYAPGSSDSDSWKSEEAPLIDDLTSYGGRKVSCEEEARRHFPNALVLRPGHITGPGDRAGFVGYWLERVKRGGDILVPVHPEEPVQWIDVRDLVEWNLSCIERGVTGTFNVAGPCPPAKFREVLDATLATVGRAPRVTWVEERVGEKRLDGSSLAAVALLLSICEWRNHAYR
jgi:2'-hydroxyisoflavone reductase